MSACEATSGCYELYSIGSAKFLREIFNSVAMITGSGDFLGACAVAIMLGVILAVIKGIMTGGGKIEVGAIVVSSLVTCIMFVPRATVVVEDVYNGSTYAVDNVPIGVAAPGMFISRVGFTIAELMDQGFSTVDTNFGITNRPFLESTKILSNLRNPQFANSVWDQLGKHTNSDVKRSFYNFFKECTMLKYNFDKTKSVDQDQKMTLENLMDDFQSNVFYTEIYVDGKAVTKTCNDANAILKSKINQLNGDLVNNAMPAPKEYGSNTATEMTDAISMLRLTSADAMEMVKLSIVQPVYDKALAGYFDNSGDVVAALTINNAIQQRNAQWSMEQSLFLNTVRPIITFFEGFVYAVTPFMAILICMGAFGLGIAIKYFQTLIWIQLWMPILAIINLYIYMSAQGAVDSAGIVDKHIDSFYALGTLAQTVETWTSVGGMLAAMTPVIAFFIVAGSAYTFTSIASKLNGADHIDEKAMSPDVLKQAPMFTNSKGTYKGTNSGQVATDMEPQEEQINFGKAISETTRSAFERQNLASVSLAQNLVKAYRVAEAAGKGEAFIKQLNDAGWAVTADMFSDGTSSASQTGVSSNSSSSRGNTNTSATGYSVTGRISKSLASIPVLGNVINAATKFIGGLDGEASLEAHYKSEDANTGTSTDAMGNTKTTNSGVLSSNQKSSGSNKQQGKSTTTTETGQHSNQYSKDDLANLQQSYQEYSQASKSYSQAASLQNSMSTTHTMKAREAAYNIGDRGDWQGLRTLIQQSNLGSSVNSKQAYYQDRLGYSQKEAHRAALLMTAINEGNTDTKLKALSMIGEATGKPIDHIPNYDANQNVNNHGVPEGNVADPSKVQAGVQTVANVATGGTASVKDEVQQVAKENEKNVNGALSKTEADKQAREARNRMNETLANPLDVVAADIHNLSALPPGTDNNNNIDNLDFYSQEDPDVKYVKDAINRSLSNNYLMKHFDKKTLENYQRLVILGSKAGLGEGDLDQIKECLGKGSLRHQSISDAVEALSRVAPMTNDRQQIGLRTQLAEHLNIAQREINAYAKNNPDVLKFNGPGDKASTVRTNKL